MKCKNNYELEIIIYFLVYSAPVSVLKDELQAQSAILLMQCTRSGCMYVHTGIQKRMFELFL